MGEHLSTGSVRIYLLFHYLFKTESFDQNLLTYHKNSDLLREQLIIILWPKTQDKPMTSPRQDNLHQPNPRQDPRQDKVTQDKPKTRKIQDTLVMGHPRQNPRQEFLVFVLSWVCLGSACLVLGLVLG